MSRDQPSHRAAPGGLAVAAAWVLAAALSAAGIGRYLNEVFTGIAPSERHVGLALVAAAALVASLALTVAWARRRPMPEASGRRRFLTGLGAALGGLATGGLAAFAPARGWMGTTAPALLPETPRTDPSPRSEWAGARIRSYRRLGRTGFEVSDISLGSAHIRGAAGERIAREAIERGVNYFDTAPDYADAGSEQALGRAMKGRRERMFVATKFCRPDGHLQAGADVRQYVEVVEASLRRLQTEYVDLVHVHACDTVERLLDPNLHEAFERLKEQGKARFLGFSSHTPNLETVANAAIDDGRFDVMMLAYHHGAWPHLGEIIARAHRRDVGVVAMKTLKGAKHEGLLERRPDGDSYAQAAFKWVLGNPDVSCLVISFFEPQHLDEYLYASGKRPSPGDLALLECYDQRIAQLYCRPHCGECLDSCPAGVPIADVLRHRMYLEDYGSPDVARRGYARLGEAAASCASCSGPCTSACPFGLPVRERMVGAHALLARS